MGRELKIKAIDRRLSNAFCHRITQTKAGQRPISHRAHRDAEILFFVVERTAMNNLVHRQACPGKP